MSADIKIVKKLKTVQERVSRIRWNINNFFRQTLARGEDPLISQRLALSDGSEIGFNFYLYCPFFMDGHGFNLHFDHGGLGNKQSLEVRCTFWLENSNGDKYGETQEYNHVFILDGDDNQLEVPNFLNRQDLFNNCFFNGGNAFICAKLRYRVSEEAYFQPKTESYLRQKLWSSYEHGMTDDFKIRVEGQEFKISKNILIANSDVFECMLGAISYKEAQQGFIEIKEASYTAMKAFVEYMHRGQLDNLSEMVEELFVLANKYNVVQLQNDCVKEISKSLNIENVFGRLQLAFMYDNDETLKKAVLDYITSSSSNLNFRQISASEEWMDFVVANKDLAHEITNTVFDKLNILHIQENYETPSKRRRIE